MKLKKQLLISFLILLSSVFTVQAESSTYEDHAYIQVEQQIDTAFEQIENKISNQTTESQIEVYNTIISRVEFIESKNKTLSEKSIFILNYIKYLCTKSITELDSDEINVGNILDGTISASNTVVSEIPRIIPGVIKPEERLGSELGRFSISGGTVSLSELELNIIGDQIFSILKGKVYIIDSDLKKIAESTTHSYYNKASKIIFKTQEIKFTPGEYTIWVQSIEAEEDTNIEIKIEDMEVIEKELEDEFKDRYTGSTISETVVLQISTITETPKIIPGMITGNERGTNEIGEFTVSGTNLNIRELELEIAGDEGFSIIEGKIYILDSNGKTIAEKSGYRYSNRTATVYFNTEKITLIPGIYTISVEEVRVEEDTNIEIKIADMKAVEDGIEDTYIGTIISEAEILYIEE